MRLVVPKLDHGLGETRKHSRESHAIQAARHAAGVPLAVFGERQVGRAGVLARDCPGGFAVPGQQEGGVAVLTQSFSLSGIFLH